MALQILVQKDEGPSLSLAGLAGLAVLLRDLVLRLYRKSIISKLGGSLLVASRDVEKIPSFREFHCMKVRYMEILLYHTQ